MLVFVLFCFLFLFVVVAVVCVVVDNTLFVLVNISLLFYYEELLLFILQYGSIKLQSIILQYNSY